MTSIPDRAALSATQMGSGSVGSSKAMMLTTGALIGSLGGMGAGGAELRLPLLIGIFGVFGVQTPSSTRPSA